MKKYVKPQMMILDNSEGVYASSGRVAPLHSNLTIVSDWGNGGEAITNIDLSAVSLEHLTILATFNKDIAACWIDGGTQAISGNTVQIRFNDTAPEKCVMHVQVANADIKQLELLSLTHTN